MSAFYMLLLLLLLLSQVSVRSWHQWEAAVLAQDKALLAIKGAGAKTHVSGTQVQLQCAQHRHAGIKHTTQL